ncbi:hypothetical protein [Ulvibacterium sp.]|uniref:hypothetical protein n=1 Tax=Ulvibacterium sp. TaxID=2665914 RepID=UPI003CC5D8A4
MALFAIFGTQEASSSFRHYLKEMTDEINSKSNDYILNVDEDEWKEYFVNKYDFTPLTLFPEQATVKFKGKRKIKKEQFGRVYESESYRFELSVPYTGYYFLFMLIPSTRRIHHPMVNVPSSDSGILTAEFEMYDQNEKQFEYDKKHLLDGIMANVPNINNDLQRFKADVSSTFDTVYKRKKEKVLSENSFFEKINIDIDKKTDKIFKVPIAKKKKIPEPIVDKKSTKKFTETPAMDDAFYADIIEVIYTFFKSVEKKPSTYKSKDEEGLRDYVLPTLETRYDNTSVTGETFNKGGKTDILIRYKDGTNLFVAECKYWKGEAVLHETINQLFDRYLTWRDSKVAIIFFVKNKEFSKVLATIKEIIPKHEYFVRENGSNGESSFSYIFHFPTDKEKFIYAEIMAFHFPE